MMKTTSTIGHESKVAVAGLQSHSLLTTHYSLARGQSVVEYAVLVAVVVAALVSMAVYTKRALSGKWRGVGDTFGHGRQYEPGTTVSS